MTIEISARWPFKKLKTIEVYTISAIIKKFFYWQRKLQLYGLPIYRISAGELYKNKALHDVTHTILMVHFYFYYLLNEFQNTIQPYILYLFVLFILMYAHSTVHI
jgi:hypothetical protein